MTAAAQAFDFQSHFASVHDPRINRTKYHQLMDILFISVAATIGGADGPSDIEDFARQNLAWCRRFVSLANGVPSHDTIGRVMSLIKPEQFQVSFLDWIAALASTRAGAAEGEPQFIPIDGKTLCGSGGSKERSSPLHLVSAWATQQGLTLGQVAVDSKSNEITAIPKLLDLLELAGAIVSIDAMGCQKEIAKKIIKNGGDYVLAVKDNQPLLAAALEEFFRLRHEREDFQDYDCRQHFTVDRARGRLEERHYLIAPLPEALKHFAKQWDGLTSIGQVITHTDHGDKQTSDIRFYIVSRKPRVKEFAKAVRGHWSIESMHWILDVVFHEDASRIRNGHASENFGFLRKFVISLLKRDTSRGTLKGKRKRAAWNTDFLEKILFGD